MTLPSLSSVSNQWWGSVCKHINKAVVFLDDETAETLHWNGGLTRLVHAGAVDVKNFSPFENAQPSQKKAVFLLNRPLHGITLNTLQDIIKASKLNYCIIISNVHFAVQYFAHHGHNDGDEDFLMENLEERVRLWMGDRNYAVELFFYPMFLATVCPSLFVTPPFSHLFPPFPSDLYNLQQQFLLEKRMKSDKKFPELLQDLDLGHLPMNLQIELKVFAHCFNSFLEQIGCKEDCFTVGHFSRIIVNILDSLPAARIRRKTAGNKVSIVLIDRTLDLVGPSGHGIDTLLDRIVNLLPRLPGHVNDVAINMSSICCAKSENSEHAVLVPGCLAQSQDAVASTILNSLVINKHKECLMDINRQLVEAITKEKLTDTLAIKPGRLNHEVLENHINHFRMKPTAIVNHCGLLQHALAAVQALQHSNNSQLDQLYGIEKGLLHNLGDTVGGQSALAQVIQLLKTRKDRSICLEDILVLLIHIYSLAGDRVADEDEEEDQLKMLLAEVLVEDVEVLSEIVKESLGEEIDELVVHTVVEQLFLKLKDIAVAREDMKKYKSVFEPGSKAQPACYMPLFRQILDDIFNPTRPELLDVEYKTMGLKDMIKTGFSLFMNVNKPRPCDNPMMIIFVVGGVTTTEVRQIRDTVIAQKPNVQILVGSTRLLKPHDVLDLVLHSYQGSNIE